MKTNIRDEIARLRKKIDEYHEDMKGEKISRFEVGGQLVTYHMSDYTATCLDALADLEGIMDMYEEHEREVG